MPKSIVSLIPFMLAFIASGCFSQCDESGRELQDYPDETSAVNENSFAIAQTEEQEGCLNDLRSHLKTRLCGEHELSCVCRDRLMKSKDFTRYISCPDEFTDVKPVVQGEEVWVGGAWDDDWLSAKSAEFQKTYYANRERDEARALQRLKKEIRGVALDENTLQTLLGEEDYITLKNFLSVYVGDEGTVMLSAPDYEEDDSAYPSVGYNNPEDERQEELRRSCSAKRLGKKLLITRDRGEKMCDKFPCSPSSGSNFRLTRIATKSKR